MRPSSPNKPAPVSVSSFVSALWLRRVLPHLSTSRQTPVDTVTAGPNSGLSADESWTHCLCSAPDPTQLLPARAEPRFTDANQTSCEHGQALRVKLYFLVI